MDLSQFTPGQIGFSFAVVFLCIVALVIFIPKLFSGVKIIGDGVKHISEKKKRHQELVDKIEENTNDIKELNQKVDNATGLMAQFVVESNARDKRIENSLSNLENKVNELEIAQLNDRLDRDRSEILNFTNRVRNGEKVTINSYYHIFDLAGNYEKIIEEKNIPNDKFSVEYRWLKDHFNKLESNDDFLKLNER